MIDRNIPRWKTIAFAAALSCANIALCADADEQGAALPNADTAAIVASASFPQQERMDIMARIAASADENNAAEISRWFIGIVENREAPVVARSRALKEAHALRKDSPELIRYVTSCVLDESESAEWRSSCLSDLEILADAAAPEEMEEIRRVLVFLCVDAESHLSGPALLAISRRADKDPELRLQASERIRAILSAPDADPDATLYALMSAAYAGDEAVVDAVRNTARDASLSYRLRLAAINALGNIGAEGDEAVLDELGASDPLLRKASAGAANRLRARVADQPQTHQ